MDKWENVHTCLCIRLCSFCVGMSNAFVVLSVHPSCRDIDRICTFQLQKPKPVKEKKGWVRLYDILCRLFTMGSFV